MMPLSRRRLQHFREAKQVFRELTELKPQIRESWREWETYELAKSKGSSEQLLCWNSFEHYRMYINGHETFTHMKVWEKTLITGNNSRYLQGIAGQDTLILAPRESAKSTYLAQLISWLFGLHFSPWIRLPLKVLGISYNIDTALPRSRQIQALITSDAYKKIFPWVRPSIKKWGEKEWMLDLGWADLSTTEEQYSYVCAGLTGAINSRRCHVVMLDDLIKSPEAIRANSIRRAMISNWEDVIQYTRYDGSRAFCLGTRMSADDIYCTTFTKENGWNVIQQSALITDEAGNESSFWEPKNPKAPGIPLKRLRLEREKTPISFTFQRQNKIIRVESQSISPELIIRKTLPSQFQVLILGVDLSAGTKENNDYTAMVLGGKDLENNYWIIDAWEDRLMGNLAKLEAMVELWNMWKHTLPHIKKYNQKDKTWNEAPISGLNLWFDSSSYGLSLQGDFKDIIIQKKQLTDWIVRPVPASGRGDKLTRLRKHSGLFENGLIFINKYGRTMADGRRPVSRLIEQITEFGSVSHDDLADAFELCISGLRATNPLELSDY